MIRWLSIGVIGYMILGIIWWGLLLSQKNTELYTVKKSLTDDPIDLALLEKEEKRQSTMILGEGFVLGCSLLLGIYIINRSANKEIQNARQQSDFLLSVSHELKSPIAAIKLAIQTLDRRVLSPEKQKIITSSALADANRLEKLVQNILLSASIESSALELYQTEFDLLELVRRITTQTISEVDQGRIHIKTKMKEVLVRGDQQNLKQAIQNITDNAVKYAIPDTDILIDLSKSPDHVICNISNEGPAIPVEERSKIFEKFYRGNDKHVRNKEGTGIGLYIAREIFAAHGGQITVSHSDNKNIFSLMLPSHEE